ncbi:MAG TPA: methyl-accepting chemotaxis protein, partial [Gemmatimonadaceae bacterium]|nr:methyl-accepting chemotaxis protein [Gemmatimonadaceae bacterium]
AGAVFASDSAFTGRAMVAGQDTWTLYEPIRDETGAVIGILYGGLNFAALQARASRASRTPLLLAIALAGAVLASLLLLAVTRRQLAPLGVVRDAALRIAEGRHVEIALPRREDEVGEVARAFARIAQAERTMAAAATRLADGDLDADVVARGADDVLGAAMVRLRTTIGTLVNDANVLCAEARAGRLGARGDASRYGGAFAALLLGLNRVLDAVTEPTRDAAGALGQLARRDLATRLTTAHEGEFAVIATAINTAAGQLDEAMREVQTASVQLLSAAEQISAGSQGLSEGASTQASALAEVTAGLHELTEGASESETHTSTARTLVIRASEAVEEGADAGTRLDGAMQRIAEASSATAKIVKTIDEIAFQTNLLALNAAVEAARAGDAGRGFAVVAEEVRSLARRAAEAAKQTAELLERSAGEVRTGVSLNAEVLARFAAIRGEMTAVVGVVTEIAAGSERQHHGLAEIRRAFGEMGDVTQAVAASAEESAAAAEELESQAQTLGELVGQFRLSVGGGGARREG